MPHHHRFYIHGQWVAPTGDGLMSVINPATEEAVATIATGGPVDVDRAVAAARRAFAGFARTSGENCLDLLGKIIAVYRKRADELAEAISTEMGAPLAFARERHVPAGLGHLTRTVEVLKTYEYCSLAPGQDSGSSGAIGRRILV